jgi:signal-transduction protein with cAMP-binding, CBS, and nucleotidyltransferase domain
MIAQELINHMIPPLKPTDEAHKAMVWMEELRSNELPVIDGGRFLGLISEEVILDENDIEKPISELPLFGLDCIVDEGAHFYDVIKMASDHQVEMVGVTDELGKYIGVITIQDTIASFAQSAAVQLPGGIIVLSLDLIDYSLAEISRLIESENAKILSCVVKEDTNDASKIRLTLKINKIDLSHITATLERFEYKIIARFQESKILEDEKDKVGMLLKYLNI